MGWIADIVGYKGLNERLATCERQLKEQALDFDELYERCRRLLGRTAKERERIEARAERGEPDSPPTEVSAADNGHRGRLSPHQVEMQQQILRRRAGMTGGT